MVAANKGVLAQPDDPLVGPETGLYQEAGFYREEVIDSRAAFGFTGGGLG
jgi:hypothetical protein